MEQLASPRVIYSLLRPLEVAYVEIGTRSPAIIYALMANRMRFLNEQMRCGDCPATSAL